LVEHGHQVVVFELAPPARPLPRGVGVVLGTVDDSGGVMAALRNARAEAVVHLARASTNHDDLTVYRSNVLGTYHVLQAAVTCGLAIAVVASSIQALGDYFMLRHLPDSPQAPPAAPHYLPLDEAHPCAPCGAYQIAKLAIEETCRAITREHGLPTVAIRPTSVVVPERWPELLRLLDAQEQVGVGSDDEPPAFSGPYRDYVDARDVGQLVRLAVERAGAGLLQGTHVLHASGADPFGPEPLAASLPRHAPHVPGMAALAAGLGPGEPGISIALARELLGYDPKYTWRRVRQGDVE
jgi:nucleoside-diphosphate-sugar epimerase